MLVEITPPEFDVDFDLAYATAENFTGRPVYTQASCYLHPDAATALAWAQSLAGEAGYRLLIFDAFRPAEAQWTLWRHSPDAEFLSPPWRGSPHSRGVAVDLTLRSPSGEEIDMGTPFDEFSARAHHGCTEISAEAQRARHTLLGIMSTAGWDFYRNEWWHYQLFDARRYTVLGDSEAGSGMM
jgi:D-alanyl-D-alanine dipeptidase